MEETKKCPKCGGEMEEGNINTRNVWVKKGKQILFGAPHYISYSCLKCGFIESYTEKQS